MFALTAVQAFFGDCLILEFGTATNPKYILIDGGPPDTYTDHLAGVLKKLKQDGHNLELMVLSHVDNDHIMGLLDFIADLRGGVAGLPSVGGLWHNSFAKTIDVNGTITPRAQALMSIQAAAQLMSESGVSINGIPEGNKLRTQALAVPITINAGFPGDVIIADTAGDLEPIENLKLTIVGPTQANLDNLRDKWEEWLENAEDAVNSNNPRIMANSDRSIPNLSSIQLYAEADDKSMLLTGDGRSDHLLQALEQANLLDAQGKLHVDLLKLPHHGSDRNITKAFFKKITADNYVVSADGTYDNPDTATLIWIAEAAQEAGRQIKIFCTNETDSTQKLKSDYPPADYGYELITMPDNEHSLRVELTD